MTPAEKLLWRKLQAGRFKEIKFRRQHSIGNYVVDFYCPKYRLIIELDGKVHLEKEQAEKDKLRDEHLKDMDYRVLRFTNDEVLNDNNSVLKTIESCI